MKKELKDLTIKKLEAKDKEYIVADRDGLTVRVRPNGSKLFQYRYQINNGKRKRHTYGQYPYIGLQEARALHIAAKAKVKDGVDINEEKKQKEQEVVNDPTIEEFANEFNNRWLKKNLKRPDVAFGLIERNIIRTVGKRKIKTITRRDIVNELNKIVDRGSSVTANRTLSILKSMFAYAVEQDIIEFSPIEILKKKSVGGKEKPRDRYFSEDEIKQFLEKIDGVPFTRQIQLVLRILLFTGKRLSEVLTMERHEINLKNRIWIIPKKKTKNNAEDKTYLTDSVIKNIKELIDIGNDSNWVCASPSKKSDHIRYNSVDRAVKRHLKHFDFKESWTPHDLRRSVVTHMNEIKILPHIVELIVGHKRPGVMGIYNKSELWEEKVEAWQLWESKLYSIFNKEKIILINSKKKA